MSAPTLREVALPLAQDEIATLLTNALAAYGFVDARWHISKADPLPEELLHAARLHSMTAEELMLHQVLGAGGVPMVSASNEWHALMRLRELLDGLPASEEAVDQALERLCSAGNTQATVAASTEADTMVLHRCHAIGGGSVPLVRLADDGFDGRGLVSTRSLAAGEAVVAVPAVALLSVRAAWRSELARVLHVVDEGVWTEHVIVILLLLHERRRGAHSRWAAWIDTLPASMHNLSAWSAAEAAALDGCSAYWRAQANQEELVQIREELLPRLRAVDAALFPDDTHASLAAWVWARSVIETRAMALPSDLDGAAAGSLVLAPCIDFANHAEAAETHLRVHGDALCLCTVCSVGEGVPLRLSCARTRGQTKRCARSCPRAALD